MKRICKNISIGYWLISGEDSVVKRFQGVKFPTFTLAMKEHQTEEQSKNPKRNFIKSFHPAQGLKKKVTKSFKSF